MKEKSLVLELTREIIVIEGCLSRATTIQIPPWSPCKSEMADDLAETGKDGAGGSAKTGQDGEVQGCTQLQHEYTNGRARETFKKDRREMMGCQ